MAKTPQQKPKSANVDLSNVFVFATTEDLADGDDLTISDIYMESYKNEKRLFMSTTEQPLPLLLSDSTIRRLVKAFGAQTSEWIDHQVTVKHATFTKDGEIITYLSIVPVV